MGEVFFFLSQDEVQTELDAKKDHLEKETAEIEAKMEDIRGQMTDLKTHLYAKFGNAINLENDEE